MRKASIIVFRDDPYNSLYEVLFEDLRNNPDVYYVYEKDYPTDIIQRIVFSTKLKNLTFGLSTRGYIHYYHFPSMIRKLKKEYDHVSVLFYNSSLVKTKYPVELMVELKKRASLNLLYLDVRDHSWVCQYANYLTENNIFDKLFTIDPNDAVK